MFNEMDRYSIDHGMDYEDQVGFLVERMVEALKVNEATFRSNLTDIILTQEYDRTAIIQAEREARMIINNQVRIMYCPLCDGDVRRVENKEIELNSITKKFNGGMCADCGSLIEESLIQSHINT